MLAARPCEHRARVALSNAATACLFIISNLPYQALSDLTVPDAHSSRRADDPFGFVFRVTLKRSGLDQLGSSEDAAMTTMQAKRVVAAALMLSGAGIVSLSAQHGSGEEPLHSGNPRTAGLKPASSPYIDAHVHIDQHDPEGAIQ